MQSFSPPVSTEDKNRVENLASQILKIYSHRKASNTLESLDELKKQYKSLPRLTKKQFENLPKEQREQYIKMLESIISKLSAIILFSTPSKPSSTTFDEQNLILNDVLKGFNHIDKDFSNITLQAMQMAIDRRREEEKRAIEEQRKILAQKVPIAGVMKKLAFQLKCLKLKNNSDILESERENLRKIFKNHLPIENNFASYFKVIPELCDTFTDYQWIRLLVALNYHEKNWLSFVENIQDFVLKSYKVEEFMLFMLMNGNEKEYDSLNRSDYSHDSEMESLRKQTESEKNQIDSFNKNIKEKWSALSDLDKLKCYLKEDSKEHYESILKKAKLLGLKDEAILELFIESYQKAKEQHLSNTSSSSPHQDIFIHTFHPNTFRETIPFKSLSTELALGFHNTSLELAKKLNIPESIITHIYKSKKASSTMAKTTTEENWIERTVALLKDISLFKTLYFEEMHTPSNDNINTLEPLSKL
ncbi:hypothetical protein FDP41_000444 [Naegleria fowleri]|uniref:Uncharacterized protein n=1 Tax=Naegleria fowleri TaxID=5763 RepID=A0A6A5CGY7_NAEFO|nr:uncharacterized protein FDP41_000444 [Naegleria fowleri]KAF0984545.1 hypothetical protein FDP41_000444 [Naegleria fowleri]